jgi:uncharacterized 2Fe-2S/4Fe-4S cluster protein (DUF4445 family)
VTVVCNPAMHHLLARLPLDTLAMTPFQPWQLDAIRSANGVLGGIFPEKAQATLPPLIGGFVGSDALACLACFDFDRPPGPIAAVDLGTNGEVMVTDGKRILTASTAAGPAFEGVNISCGSRAVDGAIVKVNLDNDDFVFETIADEPPVGVTGSGLMSLVHQLVKAGVIDPNGLITPEPQALTERVKTHPKGARYVVLTPDEQLKLKQWDIRELQKAKGAIRAAIDLLLQQLDLQPEDLHRMILTGSFGGQLDIEAILGLGLIPPVQPEVVETVANGAGLGAASFLSDEGFARAERLADKAEQIDLEKLPEFTDRYVSMMGLTPEGIPMWG